MVPIIRQRNERTGFNKIMYEQHLRRVEQMKPSVDCNYKPTLKPIPKYRIEHNANKRKIEKENAELLLRLYQTESCVDCRQHMAVVRQLRLKKQLASVSHKIHTDNINRENQRLLDALREVRPSIDIKKLEEDFQKTREKIKLMSLYPEYIK